MFVKYFLRTSILPLLFLLAGLSPQQALAASATHFLVTAPAAAGSGTSFNVSVTAQDAANATDTTYAGTVHFTSSDGSAALPADTTLTNGAATVSVTLKTAGAQTVTATDTVTASITGASGSITVAAAGLDHLKIIAPSPDTAGTPFTATVTAQDQFGNLVVTSDTFQVNSDDPKVPNPAVAGAFAAASTATVSITLKTVGGRVLTPSDTTVTLPGSPLTATVAIGPGAATQFTLVAPGSTNAGVPFTLTIAARDAYGNIATGYSGTFALASDDPAVPNLASNQTLTNGVGTSTAILYTSGTRTITATDAVMASITGTSNPITVSAQGTNHFSVTAPTGAAAGTAFSVTVTALDQFGNTVTGYGGTVIFTSTDPAATLPANATLVSGVKTVPVTLVTAGTQTIAVKDTTTPSIQGTSGAIVVNNVVPTIAVNGVTPATVTAGGAGFTITVTNTDGSYISSSVAQWNGLPLPTTFLNPTTLTATVSAGLIAAAGSATVTVANPAPGGGVSAPVTVLITNPTPTLTALSPGSIVQGSPAFSLTLTGTNFVGGSIVYWNDSPRPTTFLSSTQLNAAIVASDITASGTAQVTVHTPDPNVPAGHDSAALAFTISPFPVPVVSSLSQTSATRGDSVTLTINGTNFRPNATVTIGTLTPSPVVFVSSSQISVTFTLGLSATTGSFPVLVTLAASDGAAQSNASVIFTINAQTVNINSLTPSSVVVTTDPAVTQIVTITGSGFRSGDTVAFGSVTIDPKQVVVNTQSQITATLTGADVIGKVGTYSVVVTSPDNSSSAKDAAGNPLPAIPFTVSPQVVTISPPSPSSATARDPSFTLTITGTGFKSGAKVSFGKATLDPSLVNVVSATQITAKIGGFDAVAPETNLLTTAGTYLVQVINPDGSQSNQEAFTVNPQTNTVNNLVPLTVNVGDPTFPLTINGSGFKTGATVTFANTPLVVTAITPTQITATVPGGIDPTSLISVAGLDVVQVINPDKSQSTTTLHVVPLAPVSGFKSGIQMISVPYDYSPDDYAKLPPPVPSASIFDNFGAVDKDGNPTPLLPALKFAVWDPAAAVYDMTNYTVDTTPSFAGLADSLMVGRGYWVRLQVQAGQTVGLIRRGFLAADPRTVRGTTVLLTGQQVPIPLTPGWNMVGDPFTGPVLIGTLKVQFGNQAYGYTDAVSLGLISGTLYSYDNAGNKYVAQDAARTLDPYVGYWILALQPCTLLVPQP